MWRTTIIHDLKWSLLLAALSLSLGLIWQWPVIHQGWQGTLFPKIKELERQEAARRLEGNPHFQPAAGPGPASER